MKIPDLFSSEYVLVLKRAEERIKEAIVDGKVSQQPPSNDEIEILSFPIAVIMTAAINDAFLKRRYALAEAKRASGLLQNEEDKKKIIQMALNFNWRMKSVKTAGFTLHFTDYLRNSTVFYEKEWKLINRRMLKGEVHLTKNSAARLLEEEIRKHIEEKLKPDLELDLPQNITESIERLRLLLENRKERIQREEMPKETIVDAFPPCIRKLYNDALSGRHLSHIGRFSLASFLVNSGMSLEEIVNSFRAIPDFDERLTRYQVEHIAGGRGSREKYTPPTCDTLRTHRVCQNMDDICGRIRSPATYYRRKIEEMKAAANENQITQKV